MATELNWTSNREEITATVNYPLTTIEIVSWEFGETARAHAKHNPEDDYSVSFGLDLALMRARERLYHKISRRLTRRGF